MNIQEDMIETEVMFFLDLKVIKEDNEYLKALKMIKNLTKYKENIKTLSVFFKEFANHESIHCKEILQNISHPNLILKSYFKLIHKYQKLVLGKILDNQNYCAIMKSLCQAKDLLAFLDDKKEEDIRGLVEFVEDVGDSFLKVSVVNDLIKVLNFYNRIKRLGEFNEMNFLENFISISSELPFKNIVA